MNSEFGTLLIIFGVISSVVGTVGMLSAIIYHYEGLLTTGVMFSAIGIVAALIGLIMVIA